ncbi:MAG: hypothetical protein K1000chlam3_01219, partial [Chlamydiae bacterium]|nr:hypothetical protein [Chlamydiota bacterium]
ADSYNQKHQWSLALDTVNKGLNLLALTAIKTGRQTQDMQPELQARLFYEKAHTYMWKGDYNLALYAANKGLNLLALNAIKTGRQTQDMQPKLQARLFYEKASSYICLNELDLSLKAANNCSSILAHEAANLQIQNVNPDLILQAKLFDLKAAVYDKKYTELVNLTNGCINGLDFISNVYSKGFSLKELLKKDDYCDSVIEAANVGLQVVDIPPELQIRLYSLKGKAHFAKNEFDLALKSANDGLQVKDINLYPNEQQGFQSLKRAATAASKGLL